jgi:hypothetical protein
MMLRKMSGGTDWEPLNLIGCKFHFEIRESREMSSRDLTTTQR